MDGFFLYPKKCQADAHIVRIFNIVVLRSEATKDLVVGLNRSFTSFRMTSVGSG